MCAVAGVIDIDAVEHAAGSSNVDGWDGKHALTVDIAAAFKGAIGQLVTSVLL